VASILGRGEISARGRGRVQAARAGQWVEGGGEPASSLFCSDTMRDCFPESWLEGGGIILFVEFCVTCCQLLNIYYLVFVPGRLCDIKKKCVQLVSRGSGYSKQNVNCLFPYLANSSGLLWRASAIAIQLEQCRYSCTSLLRNILYHVHALCSLVMGVIAILRF